MVTKVCKAPTTPIERATDFSAQVEQLAKDGDFATISKKAFDVLWESIKLLNSGENQVYVTLGTL